jgi:putative aldouronate transport system permease protein
MKMTTCKRTFIHEIFDITNFFLLVLLGISTLFPFIYILALSLNDGFDAMKGGIYLWPRVFTLDNYLKAFQNPFITSAFTVTLFRTLVGTAVSVMFTAMLAYALMKKELPGRTAIVFYLFFSTLFSGGLIPYYILLRQLHLFNSIWVFIIPAIYNFFNMVIIRTYFEGIPASLAESAKIDGCSDLGIFFRIYLPLAGPILATITLFIGVYHWNDWISGTFFMNEKKLMPAATLLQNILSEAAFEDNAMSTGSSGGMNSILTSGAKAKTTPEALGMAFVMIITLPIVCIYPFLQKYFVKGVMLGSIKG